ncbi:MAG TPA: NADH-quinone oxidoreductase subunit L [Chryseosolibacter sp.]
MQPPSPLVILALLAPLASFATTSLFSRGRQKLIAGASLFFMSAGCLGASALLWLYWDRGPILINIHWFATGRNTFDASLALSNQSLVMLAVVSFISLLVHIFSLEYMAGDAGWKRYFSMLGFFTFAMQGIVLSDSLLVLFVFWELVGFSSYMLIGHWSSRPEAGRAAMKAFIMNRIGDAGFLVGLMILWTAYGTFSVSGILSLPDTAWQTAASLCIFCGVMGKSAQFPLFTWLPDAMEGPTPVSALIHAATMVAAGVYLLVRLFPIFTANALLVVAFTGMITTVLGALAALSQYDIKKILAYSTVSQLGLMILAIGMGVVDAALLHLLVHAFFKACLFLSAGVIIHSLHQAQPAHLHFDVQDIRNMGGLKTQFPLVFITFLVGGASLSGIPFFSGFLSKEAILTALFVHTDITSWMMLAVILAVSFLTVLYTFRMTWSVFFGKARAVQSLQVSPTAWSMRAPVTILAACSLWLMVSWNPFDFKGWMLRHHEPSPSSLPLTLFSILWVLAALLTAWLLFRKENFNTNSVLRNAFFADKVYGWLLQKTIKGTSTAVTFLDRRVIDGGLHGIAYVQVICSHIVAGVDHVIIDGAVKGIATLARLTGRITRSFQGGNIQLYIFWAVFAIIIFIISSIK